MIKCKKKIEGAGEKTCALDMLYPLFAAIIALHYPELRRSVP